MVEQFAGSELFWLNCFEEIWNISRVVDINIPQYAFGLDVHGALACENATLLPSSLSLLRPFRGVPCTCVSHGRLGGDDGTNLAQVWPGEVSQIICAGIQPFIKQRRGSEGDYLHAAHRCFLVGGQAFGRRPSGRPRETQEGIIGREGVVYDCPARVARRHNRQPDRTRNGEPLQLCQHYQIDPSLWTCPACVKCKPAGDPEHTLRDGCRHSVGEIEVVRRATKKLGQNTKAGPC